MALLNQAKESTMRWYGTLDKLTQCMPASTYLTGMTTTKSNAQLPEVTVNLAGVSVSQERIGEAMIRLHDIPELQRVDLHFSQSAVIDRSTVIGFEIGAVMKGSPEVKGAKTNGPSQS